MPTVPQFMRSLACLALLLTPVLSACSATDTEPPPIAPFDSLHVTLSATLAVGRTVRPTLTIFRDNVAEPSSVDSLELQAQTRLESSNPHIVSVVDGSFRANAVGRAIVSAQVAGKRSDMLVDVVAGYPVTFIEGTDGALVSGMNDSGDVIGSFADKTHFLVQHGQLRDIGACTPRDINNAGQVACVVVDTGSYTYGHAALLSDGTLTMLFGDELGAATGITESGAVFGQITSNASDSTLQIGAFIWNAGKVTHPYLYLLGETYDVNSSLHGVVVSYYNMYPLSFLVVDSMSHMLLQPNGRWSQGRAVNDADDVVGQNECMYCDGSTPTIWRAANHWSPERTGARARTAVGISEDGHVVGTGRDGGYTWQDGRYTILGDAIADSGWRITGGAAISRGGLIAAVGEHQSGKRGVVLIDLRSVH